MSVDAHAIMSTVDVTKILPKENGKNIQIKNVIEAMILSEPCLFNNSSDNLMNPTEKV